MLSMQMPFTDLDIEDIDVIRPGTVYRLTGFSGEKLIVKTEASLNVNKTNLRHAAVAMKAVSQTGGNVKLLKDSERQALADWAAFMKSASDNFAENKINNMHSGPAAKNIEEVLHHQAGASIWYKMPLADLTEADKIIEARLGVETGHADKGPSNQMLEGLKADGGLEQIGKIIAADMYIGNGDRFNPEGSTRTIGKRHFKFKAIKNIGNIFMIGKDTEQRIAFSGHDFLDPNSAYRQYDMSLQDVKEGYNEQWLGHVILDANSRKKFAENVVDDLDWVIRPNRSRFSPRRKLGKESAKRLEQGILQGMRDIVAAIDSNAKYKVKMPAGVKDRRNLFAKALGK